MKAYARQSRWSDGITVDFIEDNGRGPTIGIVTSCVLEQVERNTVPATETGIRFTREDAQRLMDELWGVGLRPSEGSGSAGSLAATERHLADMRALVFDGKKP